MLYSNQEIHQRGGDMRFLMAKPVNEATILPAGVYGAYHRYNDTYFFVVGDGEKSVDTLTQEWKEGVSNGTIEISRETCEELIRRYSLYGDNLNLKDFVEHYVAHNTVVTLYKEKKLEGSFKEYKKIWKGMDWQIVYGPGDEDYFKAHPDVEKCSFVDKKVIKILGGFEDAINTVDSINLCVEEE